MKYLAVFLLVGLGLASAYTVDQEGLSVDRFESLDQLHAGGWISDQLKETLDRMVEGFEKALEEGKTISKRAYDRAVEIVRKLEDWGVEISEKIKDALDRIGKDFEKNRPDRTEMHAGGWITDQLKEALDRMVEGFERALEEGKTISKRAYDRAVEIVRKLQDYGVEISEKIKDALDRIGKDFEKNSAAERGPISDRLKATFENVVRKMKDAVDSGKGVPSDLMKKAEDIYQKLTSMKVDISEEIRTIFEDLKSKFGRSSSVQHGIILDRLREAFERIVERIKERSDGGSGISGRLMERAEAMYEMLKNLRIQVSEKIRNIFEDLRSKVGRSSVQEGPIADRLRDAFENIVNKIKDAFDGGKGVPGDLMKKAEDMFEKLKNLGVEISDKVKSLFDDLRNKMGQNGPTSQDANISNIFDLLRRLRQFIKEKLDSEKLKEKVEELFGKGTELSEQILEMLRTKGEKAKQKILDWIDRILPDREERSISEVYDKVKEFFRDLQLDLKERFTKFGEWVKERYEKGLEKGKTRAENIKKIAKEFIEDSRVIGKDMAEEALGFFREYKKDLGKLYDNVVDKIGQILKS